MSELEPRPPAAPAAAGGLGRHIEAFPAFESMYLLSYMQLADAKASVLMAVTSSAIAYLFGHYRFTWFRGEHIGRPLVLLAATTIFLVISAAYAFAVIVPRLGDRRASLIHFRAVHEKASGQAYAAALMAISASDLFEQQATYCYDLAQTCARKYQLLGRSFFAAVLGYAAFLFTILLV